MSIAREIGEKNIQEVVHFTTNRGLVGILANKKIMSRRRLPDEDYLQYVLFNNAALRPEDSNFFDKSCDWLDYVNMSLSEINYRFFSVSQRWHATADIWWCVLSWDADIIEHSGVYFATTNNSYPCCIRETGIAGFRRLFVPVVQRKPGWSVSRGGRASNLATCEQAEVLYPGQLDIDHLRRIYVAPR